ncbi:hypothetical protein B0I35DRAFT_452324 [Stachybotrys elegans]|uniref:Zinc finger Mcm10/DnaG-type domain-containing protein n=1 Tax=Stachybotrys elegans TaxID=80388 RepID=A0A8K0SM35_9HYPO|nr:hypothetical protein B0I35DRAFT_452324 [Stachybotrys elegans]
MAPAPPSDEPHWPPRSPHEALISSPGGRAKYQRMLSQGSPSPTRTRLSRPLSGLTGVGRNIMMEIDQDIEEDEETLQLKLQEIQARLRLKKLQKAKALELADDTANSSKASAASETERRHAGHGMKPEDNAPSRSASAVEVPASPVRRNQALIPQQSPSKLLGIDKGLTAKDISLKRAPSLKRGQFGGAKATEGYPRRGAAADSQAEPSRPLSFNERLALARNEASSQAERQERIQKIRTNAFNIGEEELERFKLNAVDIPDEPLAAPIFTREDIVSRTRTNEGNAYSRSLAPTNTTNASSTSTSTSRNAIGQASDATGGAFESFSGFHLSRRILPHNVLSRHVSGAKMFSMQQLLKQVKAPNFALPDVEQDIVVFGIVAKKSEPRSHKQGAGKAGADPAKYMVINIVDLKFELDLFLFKSGFTRYWKMTEGTVIGILNPQVMPPPPGREDTGRFSLVINSDANTILELGVARDLGFCQSVKKDGSQCGSWVNQKKTHYCEYHSNIALQKSRSKRIELNSHDFAMMNGGGSGKRPGVQEVHQPRRPKTTDYDRETQTHWFATKSMSTADLIDGKDHDLAHIKERQEFVKRSLEAREKERDIIKKLGRIGDAAGKEYMQRAGRDASTSLDATDEQASTEAEPAVTAESLGLLDRQQAIHLSPIKRKRVESSQAGSVSSNGAKGGFGWGTNLRDKLSRMKDGEKLRKDSDPPVHKKTRFVTEKGIREAGRESLGLDMASRQVTFDDDDDDELLIVR